MEFGWDGAALAWSFALPWLQSGIRKCSEKELSSAVLMGFLSLIVFIYSFILHKLNFPNRQQGEKIDFCAKLWEHLQDKESLFPLAFILFLLFLSL